MASNSKNIAELLNGDTTLTATDIANDAVTADKLANSINTDIATGVAALPKSGGAMTGAITSNNTISDVGGNVRSGRKNLIINGGFDVWQRGTSLAASSSYLADRWVNGSSETQSRQTFTVGQTDVAGFPTYFHRSGGGSTTTWYGLDHKIEDVGRLGGQEVTLSYWMKGSASFTNAPYWLQLFGSGGSTSVEAPLATHSVTTSWVRYSQTFTFPSISGKTVGTSSYSQINVLRAYIGSISVDLANVQLELGSVATDFEHRSFGEEVQLCKRYYEKSFAYSTVPANGSSATTFATSPNVSLGVLLWSGPNARNIAYEVEKRATPTVVRYGNSSGYWGYINAGTSPVGSDNTPIFHANIFCQTNTPKVLVVTNQASGNPLWSISGHWTAEAEL